MRSVLLGIVWYAIFLVTLFLYVITMRAIKDPETTHFFVATIPSAPLLVFGTLSIIKKTNNRAATIITFFLLVAVTIIALFINRQNNKKHESLLKPNYPYYIRPTPSRGVLINDTYILVGPKSIRTSHDRSRNMGNRRNHTNTPKNEGLGMGI